MTARTDVPFDPSVVKPWELGEGRRGVLLIHGFAGTPPELRGLGEHLSAHGYRCRAPVLAGHGLTPESLEQTTREEWLGSARTALDELAAECDEIFVAGQSMGGTVALHLAASDMRITALAVMAAPVWLSGWLHHTLPVSKRLLRWHRSGDDIDLYDREAINMLWSYGRRPTRAIHEFTRLLAQVRNELVQVRAPVLVLHGGRDRTIDPRNAEEIAERLVCSAAVERQLFPRSGHGMSVDVDRDVINARVRAWFDRYSAAAPVPAETAVTPRRRTARGAAGPARDR